MIAQVAVWVSLASSALAASPFLPSYTPVHCPKASSCPDGSQTSTLGSRSHDFSYPPSVFERATADGCCKPGPGGLFLQTQFWDIDAGPKDSWTVHGLWPDYCNGSYPQYCNPSLEYPDNGIRTTLETFGLEGKRLENEMDRIWTDETGSRNGSEAFWAHEFNKHGTCISNYAPTCYRSYKKGLELFDYYHTTLRLFRRFPTYRWLAEAGIRPDANKVFQLNDVVSVLRKKSGAVPYLGCQNGTWNEVWYYMHVNGRVQSLDITPVDSTAPSTKCATFKWPPKTKTPPATSA